MPRHPRLLAASASTLLLALGATACGADADAGGSGRPVLRVGVQQDGIRAVLEASGLFDDLPYDIEWSEFTSGPPLVEAVAADRVDVAWVGSTPPVFGAAAGAAFKVVATVEEEDQHADSVLVPEDSDIDAIEDLEGRSVAVAKGTSAHGLLLTTLTRAGLSIDDVDVSYLAPADGQAAFRAGEVDAWVTWDPYTTATEDLTGALNLTELTDTVGDDPHLSFQIASTAALEDPDTREAVATHVATLAEAFAWANAHPERWAEGWSEESGLPLATTQAVVEQKVMSILPITDEHVAAEQQLADAFTEAGEIPVAVDFAAVVDPEVFTR